MFAVVVILLALVCLVASDAPSASPTDDPVDGAPPGSDPSAHSNIG